LLIQLNQLKPNPTNVRTVKADNLDKLVASIKSRDLLHNLVVKKNGVGYHVIDGNRRLEALYNIHGKSSAVEVECKVIEDNATEIGAMANMLREGMHPLDEADAIHTIVQDGTADYDDLASNWGQTRKWVMQRVALAELSDTVKEGFRNKEFNLGVAQLFTRVNKDVQNDIYKECNGHFSYDHIDRMIGNVKVLRSDVVIPTSHKSYKEIEFTGDLFSDKQYVADVPKFMALQKQYVDDKAAYLNKKHKSCVVIDTYPSEVKGLLKNLVQVWAEEAKEMDPKDLSIIITYRPEMGNLWIQKFKSKVEMSQKELDAIESGEIPELGLADMSNPQRELTHNLYYNYLRSEFWKAGDGYTKGHVALAMICNNIVRPSYYSDDYQEVEKYFVTYTDTPFNKITGVDDDYFDNLTQEIIKYCKANKCNSLEYFINQKPADLHNVLYKGLVASMGESQAFQSQKDHYHILVAKDWFKPSEEWLNKYKITQLRLLAHKVKCKLLPHDNKKLVIDKLLTAFKDGAVFDPIKFLDTVK
tara:strand:+ start:167 stop:1753 length:1587 start_codon:yes stop_codon:yes gene_type:complete